VVPPPLPHPPIHHPSSSSIVRGGGGRGLILNWGLPLPPRGTGPFGGIVGPVPAAAARGCRHPLPSVRFSAQMLGFISLSFCGPTATTATALRPARPVPF
jgi:hypothetical protein